MNNPFHQIPEISNALFGSNIKLLPSVNELFEAINNSELSRKVGKITDKLA